MDVYLLLFYCTSVSAVSRLYEPDLAFINFAQAIHGKKLNGSVFQEISVDSEIACQTACVGDIRCLSNNFGATKKEGKFICQLSDSDRFTSHENFREDVEAVYRGIQASFFLKSIQYVKDIFTEIVSIELKVESAKLKLLTLKRRKP